MAKRLSQGERNYQSQAYADFLIEGYIDSTLIHFFVQVYHPHSFLENLQNIYLKISLFLQLFD